MPGMLKRTFDQTNGVDLDQGANKEKLNSAAYTVKRQFDQVDSSNDGWTSHTDEPPSKRQMVKSEAAPSTNGFATNGKHYLSVTSSHEPAPESSIKAEPLMELFHVEQGIVPLSVIWERMSQEAHVELEELILDLSNLSTPQVNGYANPRNDTNVEKKNKIWAFAHKWRANFIKLGVLTAWSTNAAAVGKLIDICFWITDQRLQHRSFLNWMGELKRSLTYEKLPAPDLKTAIDVLSTGQAQWVSDLGYIPDKPLTPRQMLKGLKTINALLTIRLTTKQEIPYHLSHWSVKDGRVTFRVEDEFELDLSIANEDPTSQFYFIDFRFIFLPHTKSSLDGRIRTHLEWKVNEILSNQGLQACYLFLHELVLEQKLTILRNQAREMIRDQWKDHTRLCPSNRGIVVQYWMDRPGKKNWIEIGVSSGKNKAGAHTTGQETSQLNLRWHRHGVEVADHGIEIDVGHLSLERILKEIIARHTNYIFQQSKRLLKTNPVFAADRSSVKHRAHLFDSRECSLKIRISKDRTITITQNVVTGMFSIMPIMESVWVCMNQMNLLPDPASGAAFHIGILRCNTVLAQAAFEARRFGWKIEKVESINNETRVRLFKSEKIKFHFFRVPDWPSEWFYIAFTTSLEGDRIWLIELQDQTTPPTSEDIITGRYQRYKSSLEVKVGGDQVCRLHLDTGNLLGIEKHAALLLSQRQDIQWLQRTTGNAQSFFHQTSDARTGIPQLYLKYPIPSLEPDNSKVSHPWCGSTIKICYVGLTLARSEYVTLVMGHFLKNNPHIHAASLKKNNSLMLNPARKSFTLLLRTALGKPSLDTAEAMMDRLGSLVRFLETTRRFGFLCTEISLARMTFSYSSSPVADPDQIAPPMTGEEYSASISFPESGRMHLSFSKNNPHLLIQDFLDQELNKPKGMDNVAALLCNTLPLLQNLCTIRSLHHLSNANPKMSFFPRSSSSYHVRYHNKTVMLRFEVSLRMQGEVRMHVSHAVSAMLSGAAQPAKSSETAKEPEVKEEDGQQQQDLLGPKKLEKFWESLARTRGTGWYNLGRGIMCDFSAIGDCLQHIDASITEVFSSATDPEPEASSSKPSTNAEANGEVQSASAPQMARSATATTQAGSTLSEQNTTLSPAASKLKAAEEKPMSTTQQVPKSTNSQQTQARTTGQAAPQANMHAQQNRLGQPGTQSTLQNKPVNMNFKPGLGQTMNLTPAAVATLQAHQRGQTQSFNAPQANMAQMRPGGQTTAAPQANMQANIHKRPQPQANTSPAKKANNGQSKSQPITLE